MSNANFGYDITLPVGASALDRYKLVKTPGGVVVSAAVTDDCIGVIQDGASANATEATVRIFGVTRALAHDGSITKGQLLSANAAGRVDGHDGTTANPVIGFALEASSAQDDEILIFLGGGFLGVAQ